MATRGQIHMANSGVYLYQHFDGNMLPKILQKAIARKQRWDHEDYLARIIFCEMVRDDIEKETGFGIGTKYWPTTAVLITVDVSSQTVRIGDDSWTFAEFAVANLDGTV